MRQVHVLPVICAVFLAVIIDAGSVSRNFRSRQLVGIRKVVLLYEIYLDTSLKVNYFLFTPNNRNEACLLDETPESIRKCQFDPNLETKILIHGYDCVLLPTSPFFDIKDKLLETGQYNVILVDYGDYNKEPYLYAGLLNFYLIAKDIAEKIEFLMNEANATPEKIHLIGHSLGAQISGYTGKLLPNISRITGLDPGGELHMILGNEDQISYNDAQFVDIIHTSTMLTGFGVYETLGHSDFYVNGGIRQPNCEYGDGFRATDGTDFIITSFTEQMCCTHDKALEYFMESITCPFLAVQCDSYRDFQDGLCRPGNATESPMGFQAEKIAGLKPRTKFYLDTNDKPPYCNTDNRT